MDGGHQGGIVMSLATVCLQKFSASPASIKQVGAQREIVLALRYTVILEFA